MSIETARRPLAGLAALAAVGSALGRWGRRSGVTDREAHSVLPGDDFVVNPMWESTRAITIGAPPEAVWPWIAQMGFPGYRGGWYTPHWLDRVQWGIRVRSADEIRRELQTLSIGDRVPDSRDGSVYFTVEELEPGRRLVLRSTRHLLKPMRSIEFSWAFVLEDRGLDTKLVIRARARCQPRYALRVLAPLIGIGDLVNATSMLRGIKQRAERTTRTVQLRVPEVDRGA